MLSDPHILMAALQACLLGLAIFHVPVVHIYVPHIDHQFVSDNFPVQRGRIAAALDDIDLVGGKLLAAILADHIVTFLVVTETGAVTDIAGVYGCANHTISTFQDKKGDHGPVVRLDLEMMGFAVIDTSNRDFEFAVGRCNLTAAYASR
jgi:hypothetical protein